MRQQYVIYIKIILHYYACEASAQTRDYHTNNNNKIIAKPKQTDFLLFHVCSSIHRSPSSSSSAIGYHLEKLNLFNGGKHKTYLLSPIVYNVNSLRSGRYLQIQDTLTFIFTVFKVSARKSVCFAKKLNALKLLFS